jgi:hypothetical protein
MCIIENCRTTKSYNFIGKPPEYCGLHKIDEMVNTKHETCIICGIQASFGLIENNLRVACSKHKTNGMINLKTKNIKCLNANCDGINNKHNGYCTIKCLINSMEFTTDYLKNISNREHMLFNYLKQQYTNEIIWDKTIPGIALRPDFRMKFNAFNIIVELDEYQHMYYDKIDEHSRIETIYNALNIPLYVIRFNPNNYFENGIELTTRLDIRFELLKNTIDEIISKSATELIDTYKIIYLFYNDIV